MELHTVTLKGMWSVYVGPGTWERYPSLFPLL